MQLYWLQVLSNYRTTFLNCFFKFLNLFDTAYFFFFLIPFIWFIVSSKWGVRILYLAFTNALINFLLKQTFRVPRPSDIDPNLALVNVSGFSFPSGAAQYSMLFACVLMFYHRKPFSKILGVSFILLMGFSRLYLGVHYPIDILGGWIVGFLIFLIFKNNILKIERKISSSPRPYLMSLIVITAIINILIFSKNILLISSMLLFATAGIYLSKRYKLYLNDNKNYKIKFFRYSIVLLVIILIGIFFINETYVNLFLTTNTIALWITLFASPIIKRIRYLK